MKKIALLMIVALLCSSAYAAAPAKKPSAAVPTASAVPAASVTTNQGFVGVSLNTLPVSPFAAPSARFGFGGWSLDVGGSLANNAAGTAVTVFGRGEIPISEIGNGVRTYWAPALALFSPAGGGNSTFNLSVYLGAEYMFVSHLALFADLTAISLTSVGGTTTWVAGTNTFQVYSGGRFFF